VRQVVLDTETTGLEAERGHKIIEIGAVEVIDRRLSGRRFHRYLNPDREIDDAAMEVHGLTPEFLADKPRFAEIADELLDFIRGAELVIHNAGFDLSFLDRELASLDPLQGDTLPGESLPGSIRDFCAVIDSLALARHKHPGQKNNLDALCRRYDVDNSQRDLHGALLDAEILADVYLAMTGGQTALFADETQPSVVPGMQIPRVGPPLHAPSSQTPRLRPRLRIVRANTEELVLHEQRLVALDEASGGVCVWRRLTADT
jgi:DNA polymerase-3 subunit epsilon